MRIALELSMQADDTSLPLPPFASASTLPPVPPASVASEFLDSAFVSELLGSVDVDLNDPLIQAALAQMGAGGSGNNTTGDDTNNAKKRKGPDSDST